MVVFGKLVAYVRSYAATLPSMNALPWFDLLVLTRWSFFRYQVVVWDTRAKSLPVQRTPLSATGHTYPVYNLHIGGEQKRTNERVDEGPNERVDELIS